MTDQPKKRGRGRPRIIESPEEFDRRVDAYVEQCAAEGEPLTETGLVLALGFKSRPSLQVYSKRPEFADSVAYARLLIEHEYEKLLREPRCTGAIFALKNKGWTDRQILEHTGGDGGALQVAITHEVVDPRES